MKTFLWSAGWNDIRGSSFETSEMSKKTFKMEKTLSKQRSPCWSTFRIPPGRSHTPSSQPLTANLSKGFHPYVTHPQLEGDDLYPWYTRSTRQEVTDGTKTWLSPMIKNTVTGIIIQWDCLFYRLLSLMFGNKNQCHSDPIYGCHGRNINLEAYIGMYTISVH